MVRHIRAYGQTHCETYATTLRGNLQRDFAFVAMLGLAKFLFLCVTVGSVLRQTGAVVEPTQVKNVHLVWSNHLDLGFADFVTNIMNRYFTGGEGTCAPPLPKNQTVYYSSFFLKAINSSKYFREHPDLNVSFSYMTHSFLVDHFLHCNEETFPYQNFSKQSKLKCPSKEQIEEVESALRNGDLYFHAFPHNAQPELMDAESFAVMGIDSAANLAKVYGRKPPTVLSQRDVPGLTRGIVPVLVDRGVFGISIGANDGSPPPIVPSTVDCYAKGLHQVRTPFVWRDEASGKEVIMDIHPGGYGGITGGSMPDGTPFFARDGTLCDCIGIDGLDDVLCYAWRGDNYGPNGTDQVLLDYEKFGKAFPNARIQRSTLDAFWDLLEPLKSTLPVLTSEIGDSWMYGVSSDPLKLAEMRAMMRIGAKLSYAGATPLFLRLAIKLSEHTWGGQGGMHNNITHPTHAWTAPELAKARKAGTNPYYRFMEDSWVEQRAFISAAMAALDESSILKTKIDREFALITAPAPTPEGITKLGYVAVEREKWIEPFTVGEHVLKFDVDTGSIVSLVTKDGRVWSDEKHPLAAYMYRTHSYEEACQYGHTYNYNHGGEHPYIVPVGCDDSDGLNDTTTESKHWYFPIKNIWQKGASVILQLKAPPASRALGYGPPDTVYLTITGVSSGLDIELVWENKVPCFLPESSWFEFHPSLSGASEDTGEWKLLLDKMGKQNIDTADVVAKSGAVLHGIDPVNGGITFAKARSSPEISFRVQSLDSGLVSPGQVRNSWNFEAYDETPVTPYDGAAFNLHSNLYNTNYVVYYPWKEDDSTSRFRFFVEYTSM